MRHAANHSTCTPCGLTKEAALAYVEPAVLKKKRADAKQTAKNGTIIDVKDSPDANSGRKKRKKNQNIVDQSVNNMGALKSPNPSQGNVPLQGVWAQKTNRIHHQ